MQTYTKRVIIDKGIRNLCYRPYPNHPKGCPNFGKRDMCPPKCPLLNDVYDLDRGFWIVWTEFDFAAHCRRMKKKHPGWTRRQVECCLYWQGKVNKILKQEVADVKYYLQGRGNWVVTYCPEAMGVNVTETMRLVGVELEWPPQSIVRKVALFGVVKGGGVGG